MAHPKHKVASGVFGVAAGLGTTLPAIACTGGACASCFACVGMAGAVASVLLARIALRTRPGAAGKATTPRDNPREHA